MKENIEAIEKDMDTFGVGMSTYEALQIRIQLQIAKELRVLAQRSLPNEQIESVVSEYLRIHKKT